MPVRQLPLHPSLAHLRYQAKDLLKGHTARNLAVAQRIREFHPDFHKAADTEIFAAPFNLAAAQLALAREYGFASWTRLRARVGNAEPHNAADIPHHERISDPVFRRAVDLLDGGDVAALKHWLVQHPFLAHQRVEFEGGNYFRNPSLLEFVAENPIRHGSLPHNIVDIAEAILDAGANRRAMDETLGLVCSGRIVRECRVQIPLIDLLCDRGADPNGALFAAIGHGEFEAADALILRGARVTLPVTAALGRTEEVRRLIPGAEGDDRHRALAWGAQFGHVDVVRLLLDAGEDPNRYNPLGSHSHSTPLHQAAFAGHEQVVRLLLEHGARTDIEDVLWKGTPAGWAAYAGRKDIEAIFQEHAWGETKGA